MYESDRFAGWLWKRKGFLCDQCGGIPSGKIESEDETAIYTEDVADRCGDCADALAGGLCGGVCQWLVPADFLGTQ